MVDNLSDMFHREWNLTNNDANNVNNSTNNNYLPFQQSLQSPPLITTTDYSDQSSSAIKPASQSLYSRRHLDTGYDSDGGIRTNMSILKSHNGINHGYEHFISPRLSTKRSMQKSSIQLSTVPHQQHLSNRSHLTVNSSAVVGQHHNDKDEESNHEDGTRRRHIRLGRRTPSRSPSNKNHDTHNNTHPFAISRHDGELATTTTKRPFRLIFMRHSERANQALGSDWFSKAFRTNTYQSYDQNLPITLPKRRSEQAYEFDAPLTVRGLKNARHTGRSMLNSNLEADVCLSSIALRCVQTAERVLKGMERLDQIPIRIEPGLFECPHVSHKVVESFMTKKELIENGYKIKLEYKPLVPKLHVPESLDEYFDRCTTVMRGIIDRYGTRGGTILLVTHAPGLLALTSVINGIRPNSETFYRTVARYPPLSFFVAEYDGTKWNHSEQPLCLTPAEQ